ncbi:chloride channel protein [candidate division KSB1 bacterium]
MGNFRLKRSLFQTTTTSIPALINRILFYARSSEYTFIVFLAVIIGVIGGLGAVGFRYIIRIFQLIAFGEWTYTIQHVGSLPWYWKLCVPALGGLIVGLLIHFFAKEAKGHGVPEVMEAVIYRQGLIRPRVSIIKALASAICIGSGGSVGREGPIVQIGSSLGSTLGQIIKANPQVMRILVSCGAAAGIAATFNAPIAGALFAVEIILGDFGISRFSPIVISSVMATVISRHFFGDTPAFIITAYELVSPWELIFYAVLGLLAGIISIAFIKSLYGCEDFFNSIRLPGYLKPALGGFVIGGIGILFPHIFGVGYETIGEALKGNIVWYILLALVFLKILATSLTIGSGGSGGIFAPSLFIGAMMGGVIGIIVHTLFPSITANSGAYALVAMGAIVAGSTHAPLTAILILFELTNDYQIILPLMISCMISTLLSTRLHKDSIYTLKLRRRGIDIYRIWELNILKNLKVKDFMITEVKVVKDNTTLPVLLDNVVNSTHSCFFVTNSINGELEGVITVHDLRALFMERELPSNLIIAKDIVNPDITSVFPEDNLDLVMKLFSKKNIDEIPVIENMHTRNIIGQIDRRTVIEAYNSELFNRDSLDGISERIPIMDRGHTFELSEGYMLSEVETPFFFVGKTLKELNVRQKYGVEIILVKRQSAKTSGAGKSLNSDHVIKFIPDPDDKIQPGDIFLVVGNKDSIKQLKFR